MTSLTNVTDINNDYYDEPNVLHIIIIAITVLAAAFTLLTCVKACSKK